MFTVLFFGDVIGAIGRQALVTALPGLKARYKPQLTIANVENLAHGSGVTLKTLEELAHAGIDAFTGGNHSWENPLGSPLYEDPAWRERMVVPMNYGEAKGGHMSNIIDVAGVRVLIASISGQLFSHTATTSPFKALDDILGRHVADDVKVRIIDIHAEATAEKEALGHFADGRVSAVLGTHTHVATADAKILPGGTAYATDVGRCGAHDSVIGFEKNSVVKRFINNNQGTYELEKHGSAEVNGLAITVDLDSERVVRLDRIREILDV